LPVRRGNRREESRFGTWHRRSGVISRVCTVREVGFRGKDGGAGSQTFINERKRLGGGATTTLQDVWDPGANPLEGGGVPIRRRVGNRGKQTKIGKEKKKKMREQTYYGGCCRAWPEGLGLCGISPAGISNQGRFWERKGAGTQRAYASLPAGPTRTADRNQGQNQM